MNTIAYLSAKAYPDEYFSVGIVPRKKKGKDEKEYDREHAKQFNSYERYVDAPYGKRLEKVSWLEGETVTRYRLDSSPESSQPKKRYGENGITAYGKRMVKSAAAALQKRYGKKRLGFITCTIPGYSCEQIEKLAKNWGDVIRVFFQRLKRELDKIGAPNIIVGVSEIQPQRYNRDDVVAPHVHFIYVCKRKVNSDFFIHVSKLRMHWGQTLINICGLSNSETNKPITYKGSVHAVVIKKSCVAYLGKYMSKGGEVLDKILEQDRASQLPRQWWTMSQACKKLVDRMIKTIPSAMSIPLMYHPDELKELGVIRYYKEIYINLGGEERLVGVVGYFSSDYIMQVCVQS